jgi:hypothetical protein
MAARAGVENATGSPTDTLARDPHDDGM